MGGASARPVLGELNLRRARRLLLPARPRRRGRSLAAGMPTTRVVEASSRPVQLRRNNNLRPEGAKAFADAIRRACAAHRSAPSV